MRLTKRQQAILLDVARSTKHDPHFSLRDGRSWKSFAALKNLGLLTLRKEFMRYREYRYSITEKGLAVAKDLQKAP